MNRKPLIGLILLCFCASAGPLQAQDAENQASVQAPSVKIKKQRKHARSKKTAAATKDVKDTKAAPASSSGSGDEGGVSNAYKIAQATLNPLAPDYFQIPVQSNINFDQGSQKYRSVGANTNQQMLIPINLGDEYMVLLRPIVPINFAPATGPNPWQKNSSFGLGDFNPNAYFTTAKPLFVFGDQHFLTASVGPGMTFPTETSNTLGNHRYAAGPQWALVYGNHAFQAAFVFSQLWSVGSTPAYKIGVGDVKPWKKVNSFSLEPIISYTFQNGWYLAMSQYFRADWTAPNRQWTVPLGGGIGKAFQIGGQNFAAQATAYYNVVRQRDDAHWQLQLQLTAVLPNYLNDALRGRSVKSN